MSDQQLSIFSSEERLANPSASPDFDAEWMMLAATSPESFAPWLASCAPVGSFGKTSPEFCRRTSGGTLVPSSGRWSNSGMASSGGALTLSTSVHPSDASVCSLSDILEIGDVPQRYYLSPRACAGILRRAAKRGRELPPQLRRALEAVAGKGKSKGKTT